MTDQQATGPQVAAVLITDRWSAAERAWAQSWAQQTTPVQRIVVDTSAGGIPSLGPIQTIRAPGARGGPAANAALAIVDAPWTLFVEAPVAPPRGLLNRLPSEPAVLFGQGEPPDGLATTALDALMLHLLPPDGSARAPGNWPSVPEGVFAVFPTEPLRDLGGLDPQEPHLMLAIQLACLALGAREVPMRPVPGLRMGVPRRSYDALVKTIRDASAARIQRLRRDPETPLDSGWSLASRSAVAAILRKEGNREARAAAVRTACATDPNALAHCNDWVPIGRDLLRRLVADLRHLAQLWPLEGLIQGLDATRASAVPGLLSRHPLKLARGAVVVVPIERHEPAATLRVLNAILRDAETQGTTVALVAGPSTGAALRATLAEEWGALRLMALLNGGDLILHPMPLSAARAVRLLSPATAWVPDRTLHSDAWAMHARVVGCPPVVPRPATPMPVQLDRPVRLLAVAPALTDDAAWTVFSTDILSHIAHSREFGLVCLPPPDTAADTVEAHVRGLLPNKARLAVKVLPRDVPKASLPRLAAAVHATVGPIAEPLATALMLPHSPTSLEVLNPWIRISGGSSRPG